MKQQACEHRHTCKFDTPERMYAYVPSWPMHGMLQRKGGSVDAGKGQTLQRCRPQPRGGNNRQWTNASMVCAPGFVPMRDRWPMARNTKPEARRSQWRSLLFFAATPPLFLSHGCAAPPDLHHHEMIGKKGVSRAIPSIIGEHQPRRDVPQPPLGCTTSDGFILPTVMHLPATTFPITLPTNSCSRAPTPSSPRVRVPYILVAIASWVDDAWRGSAQPASLPHLPTKKTLQVCNHGTNTRRLSPPSRNFARRDAGIDENAAPHRKHRASARGRKD